MYSSNIQSQVLAQGSLPGYICEYLFQSSIFISFGRGFSMVYIPWISISPPWVLSCVQLFCDPMDCSPPGSSVHGTLQARIPEWVAFSSSRGSSRPRDQTCVSCTVEPPLSSFFLHSPVICSQLPFISLCIFLYFHCFLQCPFCLGFLNVV